MANKEEALSLYNLGYAVYTHFIDKPSRMGAERGEEPRDITMRLFLAPSYFAMAEIFENPEKIKGLVSRDHTPDKNEFPRSAEFLGGYSLEDKLNGRPFNDLIDATRKEAPFLLRKRRKSERVSSTKQGGEPSGHLLHTRCVETRRDARRKDALKKWQVQVHAEGTEGEISLDDVINYSCGCSFPSRLTNRSNLLTTADEEYLDFLRGKELIQSSSNEITRNSTNVAGFHIAAALNQLLKEPVFKFSNEELLEALLMKYAHNAPYVDIDRWLLSREPESEQLLKLKKEGKASPEAIKSKRDTPLPLRAWMYALDYSMRKNGYSFSGFTEVNLHGRKSPALVYAASDKKFYFAMPGKNSFIHPLDSSGKTLKFSSNTPLALYELINKKVVRYKDFFDEEMKRIDDVAVGETKYFFGGLLKSTLIDKKRSVLNVKLIEENKSAEAFIEFYRANYYSDATEIDMGAYRINRLDLPGAELLVDAAHEWNSTHKDGSVKLKFERHYIPTKR